MTTFFLQSYLSGITGRVAPKLCSRSKCSRPNFLRANSLCLDTILDPNLLKYVCPVLSNLSLKAATILSKGCLTMSRAVFVGELMILLSLTLLIPLKDTACGSHAHIFFCCKCLSRVSYLYSSNNFLQLIFSFQV